MLSIIQSMDLQGLNGYLVYIEVDISNGLPCFDIVGLPGTSIRESKERVKTAIKNSSVKFLSRKVVVNLAPANIKKEGVKFDLPIAIGILMSSGEINNNCSKEYIKESVFIGELSLNGSVEKVNGVLPICIEAKKKNIKRIFLPNKNVNEAAVIEGIDIIPVESLAQIKQYLNGKCCIKTLKNKKLKIENNNKYNVDFCEVKGQENAKRALEIAAAGGHNCLLIR